MARRPNSEKERSSKSSSKTRGAKTRSLKKAPSKPEAVSKAHEPLISFYFISLFPEIFSPILTHSLLGKALKKGLVHFDSIQLRNFAKDRHHTVDDTPYGGGEGMVLRADVLHSAWESVIQKADPQKNSRTLTIMLSPQGEPLTQAMAKELTQFQNLILVCGHYEGVDERFIDLCVDREISIGDYVLTGGELPALVLADTVARLVPGVVGNERSLTEETFEKGLLKYPQYTRPREFKELLVPEILLSGDHGAIAKWRSEQMHERTKKKRPDLLDKQSH